MGLNGPSRACSVPVFRYALERWPADLYEVFVFHRGKLSAEAQAVVNWLGEQTPEQDGLANCRVTLIDLDTEQDPFVKRIWEGQSKPKLPWMVVRYPLQSGINVDVWAGPLTQENAQRLVDSPARRAVVKRLAEGESAVWVLLESGKKADDDAAAARLQAELKKLEGMLELPDPTAGTWYDGQDSDEQETQLRLAFSVVRVRRDDPAEQIFVQMLLQSEEDLTTFAQPMAFPILGRGRLLFALVGEGISPDMILEACAFITGPCSCQVKDLNPGVDLLVSADWESLIDPMVDEAMLAEVIGRATSKPAASPNAPRATTSAPAAEDGGSSVVVRNVLITLVGVGALSVGLALLIRRRSRHA